MTATAEFRDRAEAGRALAAALEGLRGRDVVVLALPRGGVPVGAQVARALTAQIGASRSEPPPRNHTR